VKKYKIEMMYGDDRHETVYSDSLRELYEIYECCINNKHDIQLAQVYKIGKRKHKLLEEITYESE
jgi:hypothetical protein